jgi:hypothetical protein
MLCNIQTNVVFSGCRQANSSGLQELYDVFPIGGDGRTSGMFLFNSMNPSHHHQIIPPCFATYIKPTSGTNKYYQCRFSMERALCLNYLFKSLPQLLDVV